MYDVETVKLKGLYESGLEIVESNGLYNVWKTIPKGLDKSFGEMIRQNVNPKTYDQWWLNAEGVFRDNSLNYLRFKKAVFRNGGSEDYGIGRASRLLMALDELEKIIDSQSYLAGYKLTTKKPQQWPEIHHKDGAILQGGRQHKFSDNDAIKVLDQLWSKREIIRPDETVFKEGQPVEWKKLGKSIDRNKSIAQAVNKSMRQKGITLRIVYPKRLNGLMVIVKEKRTN